MPEMIVLLRNLLNEAAIVNDPCRNIKNQREVYVQKFLFFFGLDDELLIHGCSVL